MLKGKRNNNNNNEKSCISQCHSVIVSRLVNDPTLETKNIKLCYIYIYIYKLFTQVSFLLGFKIATLSNINKFG